jgi:tetratricopeptide (TPR) repeat protein
MRHLAFLLAIAAASCSPADDGGLDAAAAAMGRSERTFWASYDKARAALVANDVDGARAAFTAALIAKPGHAASLYALAGLEHRAGRRDEALRLCDRLLEVDRPRTRAYLLRAAIQSDVEAVLAAGGTSGPWFDLAKADADAAAAAKENPEETGPHVAHAKVALLRGDLATADACLARALTIHPGHGECHVLRAVLADRRGDAAGAAAAAAKALAVTTPKESTLPPGEGDTVASLAAATKLDTNRLRALAAALRFGATAWPPDAPLRPRMVRVAAIPPAPAAEPLRAAADFDGDGAADELVAHRAPEGDALRSLFGVRNAAKGSFTLRLAGRDATAGSGLDGVAACAAALVALDADADGRTDVLVLPGAGDPSRVEPPLLLRNRGGGTFAVEVVETGP